MDYGIIQSLLINLYVVLKIEHWNCINSDYGLHLKLDRMAETVINALDDFTENVARTDATPYVSEVSSFAIEEMSVEVIVAELLSQIQRTYDSLSFNQQRACDNLLVSLDEVKKFVV